MNEQVPPRALIDAYERHGSVWKAGVELGISGQSVSRWLKKLGHATRKRWVTEHERSVIRDYYENTPPHIFDLNELASILGRTKQLICREAFGLGLTDTGRQHNAEVRSRLKVVHKGKWDTKVHPRGMAGKTHSDETKAVVSAASKRMWSTHKAFGIGLASEEATERRRKQMTASRAAMPAENAYSRCRSGRRPDLGDTFFRSSWEANYARYLNLLLKMGAIEGWAYEPETFWFGGVRRGCVSYKPDFRIKHKGDDRPEYVELKGYETAKDRTKWRRMKKYHPAVNLTVIGAKGYYALARKWASAIPNWETDKGGGRKLGPRQKSGGA